MAAENMVHFSVQPQGNNKENKNNEMNYEDDNEEESEAQFQAINNQLDQLHSALDEMERKNDSLQTELVKLLKSNKEVRKQIQESSQE